MLIIIFVFVLIKPIDSYNDKRIINITGSDYATLITERLSI